MHQLTRYRHGSLLHQLLSYRHLLISKMAPHSLIHLIMWIKPYILILIDSPFATPRNFQFPFKNGRKFNSFWTKDRPWLTYGIKTDNAYCMHCICFQAGLKHNQQSPFTSCNGFRNWKKAIWTNTHEVMFIKFQWKRPLSLFDIVKKELVLMLNLISH